MEIECNCDVSCYKNEICYPVGFESDLFSSAIVMQTYLCTMHLNNLSLIKLPCAHSIVYTMQAWHYLKC